MGKTQYMTSEDSSVYIDPDGAEQDKREIDKAIAEIDKALELLKPSNIDTTVFQGNAYEMTRDKFEEIRKQLVDQRQKCIEIKNDITSIVNHYIALDHEIQRKVSEVINGG